MIYLTLKNKIRKKFLENLKATFKRLNLAKSNLLSFTEGGLIIEIYN